jgi:hypothetical protein
MHCRANHEVEKEKLKTNLKKYYNVERRKNTVNIEIIKNDNRTDNKIKEGRRHTSQK